MYILCLICIKCYRYVDVHSFVLNDGFTVLIVAFHLKHMAQIGRGERLMENFIEMPKIAHIID